MDIMNLLQLNNGAIISKVCTYCNLSFYAANVRLEALQKEGYVTFTEEVLKKRLDGTQETKVKIFKLTPKGQQFLVDMNKYREVISNMCL